MHTSLLPLTVDRLTFSSKGKKIINNITFQTKSNGITFIIGPHGAGKTLTLRMIHGILKPDCGTILWGKTPPIPEVRKRQSMLFQSPILLRRSVSANIEFVLKQRNLYSKEKCDALLHEARLSDKASLPAQILSGGEKKRLALIRALATEPEILLLDEPTANLDPVSIFEIEKIITATSQKGIKIFLVSHDINHAKRLADHVIFLYSGTVIEQSAASDFFRKPQHSIAQNYLDGKIVI
jgi:tungstate transport system ATP-binding protein